MKLSRQGTRAVIRKQRWLVQRNKLLDVKTREQQQLVGAYFVTQPVVRVCISADGKRSGGRCSCTPGRARPTETAAARDDVAWNKTGDPRSLLFANIKLSPPNDHSSTLSLYHLTDRTVATTKPARTRVYTTTLSSFQNERETERDERQAAPPAIRHSQRERILAPGPSLSLLSRLLLPLILKPKEASAPRAAGIARRAARRRVLLIGERERAASASYTRLYTHSRGVT